MEHSVNKLKNLENKFKQQGYSNEEIKDIENRYNCTSTKDKIENLIFESTNWV